MKGERSNEAKKIVIAATNITFILETQNILKKELFIYVNFSSLSILIISG